MVNRLADTTPGSEIRTVGDARVSIDSTAAVISGHTSAIGRGARATTITAGGQTISTRKTDVAVAGPGGARYAQHERPRAGSGPHCGEQPHHSHRIQRGRSG